MQTETRPVQGASTSGAQDIAAIFATRLVLVVFGLLTQSVLAYTLLPAGRGAYAVCVLFASLLGVLFAPGVQHGAHYFVLTQRAGVSQGVSAALAVCLAGTGVAVALALPLIQSDIAFFHKAETRAFYLALVLIPLTAFSLSVEHQFAALRRFGRLAVFSLLRGGAQALALVFLVWNQGLGVNGALVAFAAGHCVMIAVGLRDLRRHCGLVPEMPRRSSLRRILGYGLKNHVARIADSIEWQLGALVLGLIASRAEVGLFAAASVLMFRFSMISYVVARALLPRITGVETVRPELVARCLRLVGWTTAAALAGFIALSTPLVRLLLSDAFLPAVPLIRIIAPGVLACAVSGVFEVYFMSVNRPQVCSWAACLGLGVHLGALFLLYPTLGMAAAAWALTLSYTGRCLFLAIMYRRTTQTTWQALWRPRRDDATVLWALGRSVIRAIRERSPTCRLP